jgi:hypothetical protein
MSREELDLESRIEDLTRRLQAAEDVQAIQNLKARYGALADRRYTRRGPRPQSEIDGIAREISELFTEDGVWDGGKALGLATGREEIRKRFAEPTLSFSWHYFVQPEIQVDGDRAEGTWNILAPCTSLDGQAMWMAGSEKDEYVRTGGEWLHQRMGLSVVFLAPHDVGWAAVPRKSSS